MGKDLRGKELGVGITQRKDGLYQGRYKDRFGKSKTIYNSKLSELRKELSKAVTDNQQFTSVRDSITLDAWFDRWMNVYKKKRVRPNTIREYTHIYKKNISPYLGNHEITSIRKSDVQLLIDKASDDNYKYERQSKIKVILNDMFSRAMEDDLMIKNPAKGVKLRADKEVNAFALTVEQQNEFLKRARAHFTTTCIMWQLIQACVQENCLHSRLQMYIWMRDILMLIRHLCIRNTLKIKARHFMLSHQKPSRVTDTYQLTVCARNI